jgi:hypothetical protein
MNKELAEFAEEVRRACIKIAGAAHVAGAEEASQLALTLCSRAAVVRQGELMKEESAASDRYDLAGLAVNLKSQEAGEDLPKGRQD